MTHPRLTGRAAAATHLPMQVTGNKQRRSGRFRNAAAVLMLGVMTLAGCVTVNAPDKPIVIELNINIKHELIVELAKDAEKAMDQHKDIF